MRTLKELIEATPKWKRRTNAEKRERRAVVAMIRMGVDPEAVMEQMGAGLTEMLEEVGLAKVIEALRFSTDPIIIAFLKRYDGATKRDQAVLPMEAYALAAGIELRSLAGAILFALREYSALEVKIAALTAHAAITKAGIENALTPKGVKDREMIHSALGLLAPPKGQTINFNQISLMRKGG